MLKRICTAALLAGTAAQADLPYACEGSDPDWFLTLGRSSGDL